MKAICTGRAIVSTAPTMLPVTVLPVTLLAVTLLAGCVAPPATPQGPASSSSPPAPATAPAPAPARAAIATDWRDRPLTAGDWTWGNEGGRSTARFAGGAFVVRCEQPGLVSLTASARGANAMTMTITTTTLARTMNARPGPAGAIAATLPASDSLLDAIAFSRGRFVVQIGSGTGGLTLPGASELGRVVEDCR